MYQVKRQFPRENFHYVKNIKIIGGIDLNEEKFTTEYQKRYLEKWSDYKLKNAKNYMNALAYKQHQTYIDMVHGKKEKRYNSTQRLDKDLLITRNDNSRNNIYQTVTFEKPNPKNEKSFDQITQNKLNLTSDNIQLSNPSRKTQEQKGMEEMKLFIKNNTNDKNNPYKSEINLRSNAKESPLKLPTLENRILGTTSALELNKPGKYEFSNDESLQHLKQKYLAKMNKKDNGYAATPSIQNFRQEHKMYYQSNEYDNDEKLRHKRNQTNMNPSLIKDVSVQGMEGTKFAQRLDQKIDKQKHIYDDYALNVSQKNILSQISPIKNNIFTERSNSYSGIKTINKANGGNDTYASLTTRTNLKSNSGNEILDNYQKNIQNLDKKFNSVIKPNHNSIFGGNRTIGSLDCSNFDIVYI